MDRLEAMSILLEAVESGSLSAAGRRLNMPLASVSRKVADLEAHLRTRLFNRSTRRLTLTDAGLLYVAAARRILDDLNEAERTAAGEYSAPQGELVITAPVMFGRLHMLPVVTAFLRAYPDVDVRLLLTDRLAPLLEEHVDLAVRIAPLADSSLVALRLGVIRRVVCASPAYLAKHGTPQRPEELARHDCINFVFPRSSTAWTFGFGKAEIEVQVRSRLIVTTAEAAIDAATEGSGLTRLLSYQVAQAVHDGTLEVVLEASEPASWPISLVHTGQDLMPLKLRAFLDFAGPRLKERCAPQNS